MRDRKLVQTLGSLREDELVQFKAMIHLPAFNPHPSLAPLLESILQAISQEQLQPEEIFKKAFPRQVFKAERLNLGMNRLYQLLKQFLAFCGLQDRPQLSGQLLLEQLDKRGLDQLLVTERRALSRKLEAQPYRDLSYFQARYELAQHANEGFGKRQIRTFDQSLQEKADSLDYYFLASRLKDSCEMLNRRHVFNADYQLHALSEWIHLASHPEYPYHQIPVIQIYHQILRCLLEDLEEDFRLLVQLLDQHWQKFPSHEVRDMYKYAQNFCIRRINRGEGQFLSEIFILYRRLLSNEVIYESGQMAHTDYKNIATTAIRLGEITWAGQFIQDEKKRLSPEHQENAYHFNQAQWLFACGKGKQAIRLLQVVSFSDIHYQLSARYLLLKIYFEQGDTESLGYFIPAFRAFLKRNKEIEPQRRQGYLNFLTLINRLTQLKDRAFNLSKGELQNRIQKVRERLQQLHNISNREWLEEKLGEY